MDKLGSISFIYSLDTEVERIIHTSLITLQGFYTQHGFAVLPKLPKNQMAQVAVLPNISCDKIDLYWKRVGKLKEQFPMKIPPDLFDELKVIAPRTNPQIYSLLKSKEQEWCSVWPQFKKLVKEFMADRVGLIGSIEVRLTEYGTISSYSYLTQKKNQHYVCYLRSDASLAHLAEAILTALLYPKIGMMHYSWREREAVVDFLLTSTVFTKLFHDYKPTLSATRFANRHLYRESNAYISRLGIPIAQPLFDLKNGSILYKNIPITPHLSVTQRKVVSALLSSPEYTLTYDELADIIWGEGELPSLWALTKAMQRLRDIMRKYTEQHCIISPIKGYGYKLTV